MFFRTGEFARMLSVEKSVLIYYDRIGLFCPVHVDGNGYRCYSAEQTRDFHFLRLLRDLGLSLDEIAAALRRGTLPRWKRCSEPVHRCWIGKLRA